MSCLLKHNFCKFLTPPPYAKLIGLPLKAVMIMCHFEFMCRPMFMPVTEEYTGADSAFH